MKYKFIIGAGFLLIAFLSLGCGYFDNDKVEYHQEITKNISLQKREYAKSNDLMFKETNDVSAVIIADCSKVYYDSVGKKIYVETYHSGMDRNYFQIDILDPMAIYVSLGVKKRDITKQLFDEKTRNILKKWVFER